MFFAFCRLELGLARLGNCTPKQMKWNQNIAPNLHLGSRTILLAPLATFECIRLHPISLRHVRTLLVPQNYRQLIVLIVWSRSRRLSLLASVWLLELRVESFWAPVARRLPELRAFTTPIRARQFRSPRASRVKAHNRSSWRLWLISRRHRTGEICAPSPARALTLRAAFGSAGIVFGGGRNALKLPPVSSRVVS